MSKASFLWGKFVESHNLQSYYQRLLKSSTVNFHFISLIFLATFYTFCAILIGVTAIELQSAIYVEIILPLGLFYIVIIFSLVQGFRGLQQLNPHTRKYSLLGLGFAMLHQLLVISMWTTNYMTSLIVLYLVLILEIILLLNMSFNQKFRHIFQYISQRP